jgi:hypothetical protein
MKMKKSGKQESETRIELEADVDALFRLPLAEFTGARNTLAARLKKSGHGDEAIRVKTLAKPSVSAWAVNQLYWNHREAFDRLIESGERFHKAQGSRGSGKIADMRTALAARREALAQLSDLATALLRDAGPNPGQSPTPDTVHRITTTLEAMSAYASRTDARHSGRPGRLTHDIDPPGFESFASLIPGAGVTKPTGEPARFTPSQKSRSAATNTRRKVAQDDDVRQLEEMRKAKVAAARVSLQDAKRSLTEARVSAQSLEAAQKKADAEAKKAEKDKRDAEENLQKAKADVEEAARAVKDAERTVEKASNELESLFGESSGR